MQPYAAARRSPAIKAMDLMAAVFTSGSFNTGLSLLELDRAISPVTKLLCVMRGRLLDLAGEHRFLLCGPNDRAAEAITEVFNSLDKTAAGVYFRLVLPWYVWPWRLPFFVLERHERVHLGVCKVLPRTCLSPERERQSERCG